MIYSYQDFVEEFHVNVTFRSGRTISFWTSVFGMETLPRWTFKSMYRDERDWLDKHYPTGARHYMEWETFWKPVPKMFNKNGWCDKPRDPKKVFWENVGEVCQMLNTDGTYSVFDEDTGKWQVVQSAKRICQEMLLSGIGWVDVEIVRQAQNKLKKRAKKKAA